MDTNSKKAIHDNESGDLLGERKIPFLTRCLTAHRFSDGKGTVISLISQKLENRCKDYKALPDIIKNALNDGNRILLIHKIN